MIKRILKWIGIFLAGLIILILLAGIFAGYKSAQYEETAVPYLKEVVPIISQWDAESSRVYFSPAALKEVSEEDYQKLFSFLSRMGGLLALGDPVFHNVSSGATLREGANTIVTYTITAEYEYGDALITIRLVEKGDSFEIYHFNLNSTALLD